MTGEKVKEVFQLYLDRLNHMPEAARLPPKQMPESSTHTFLKDISFQTILAHLKFVCEEGQRFIDAGHIEKAMRWLGFIQGVLWTMDVFTLEALKNHSRPAPEQV